MAALLLLGCGGPKPSAALANPPPVLAAIPMPDEPLAEGDGDPAPAGSEAASEQAAGDAAAGDAATDQRGAAGVIARELDGALHRLGARVREEDSLPARAGQIGRAHV